jgi:hypothetical protein
MELKNNQPICKSYIETLKAIGHDCVLTGPNIKGSLDGASTDMGKLFDISLFYCPN